MEQKHTPGPWTWKQTRGNNIYEHSIHAGPNGLIAELNPPDWINTPNETGISQEIKANARLIAQSPALLDALKKLTEAIDLSKVNVRKDFHLLNVHAAAVKAMREAEGEN